MKLVIYNRDFSDRVQPDLDVVVDMMTYQRVGGCKEMRAKITGKDETLLAMLNDLRCPVELYDDNGIPVWWGFIFEVKFERGGVTYGNSLDKLYNRARVDYTEPDSTTVKSTTFASDAGSVATYGYKEIIATMSDVTEATAELKRTAILTNYANPTPNFAVSRGGNAISGSLLCRGWADTLKWQIAETSPIIVGVEYADLGTNLDDVNYPVFQQFAVPAGSNMTMREVALYANMYAYNGVDFPTDNLLVEIFALSGGNPTGAALATATIAPGSLNGYNGVTLPTEAERIVTAFAAPVELTAGTQYGLKLSRSGAPNEGVNYFVVMTNSALGYSGGYYRWFNSVGSTWDPASPDVDLVFTLYSDELKGVARQIKELVTDYAQFITGIGNLSGCIDSVVSKYYPGNTTAWQVLSEFFDLGGDNGRELFVSVDVQRRLSVDEEPAATDGATYIMSMDGELLTWADTPVELSDLWGVCGQYVALRDDQFAELSAISQSIIEEVEWSASSGTRVILKGQIRIEDLGL